MTNMAKVEWKKITYIIDVYQTGINIEGDVFVRIVVAAG